MVVLARHIASNAAPSEGPRAPEASSTPHWRRHEVTMRTLLAAALAALLLSAAVLASVGPAAAAGELQPSSPIVA